MNPLDKEALTRTFSDIFTACTALSEEDLAQYAELEVAGREPRERLPEIGAHLDACSDCAGRYAELLTWLTAEVRGEVPPMSLNPSFDLGFLRMADLNPWVEVKKTVYRLVAEIPIVIQRAMTTFGPLPPPLVPCRVAVAAGTLRREGDTPAEIESLRIPLEPMSLLFLLTPRPTEADEQSVTLFLRVEDLLSGQPVGQARVSLYDAQAHLLQSKTTAADGQAVFTSPAGDYILRCKHAGRTGEFPIKLSP